MALPMPRLQGSHQLDNAGLAIAMLRHQNALSMPESAFRAGMGWADWPARLQRLERGPLTARLPAGSEVWLDGGHNPAAGRVLADAFRSHNLAERPFYLVLGMLSAKDAGGFLKPFANRATAAYAVPIEGHACHPPEELAAATKEFGIPGVTAPSVADALAQRNRPPVVLITGSLYLAGTVLAENGYTPT